jgi:hypothetical protein
MKLNQLYKSALAEGKRALVKDIMRSFVELPIGFGPRYTDPRRVSLTRPELYKYRRAFIFSTKRSRDDPEWTIELSKIVYYDLKNWDLKRIAVIHAGDPVDAAMKLADAIVDEFGVK